MKAMVSSSPGRPENFPTPGLARILLLRGKSKSRSKSRARSGPIFFSRSRSVGRRSSGPTLSEEEEGAREGGRRGGEPSSPKVTCIGQVRIRNKNKNKTKTKIKTKTKTKIKNKNNNLTNTSSSSALLVLRCRCCCCCSICPRQQKKDPGRPYRLFSWRKKKAKKSSSSSSSSSPPAAHVPQIALVREVKIGSESESESDRDGKSNAESDDDGEKETKVFVSSSSSPPKNALLLMRCRSAPHNRSSALATCRFVVSPVAASESEGEGEEVVVVEEEKKRLVESEEEVTGLPAAVMAVSLMRCNSEPAKKGEKLMEVSHGKWNGSGSGGSREQGGGLGMAGQEERHSPPSILSR